MERLPVLRLFADDIGSILESRDLNRFESLDNVKCRSLEAEFGRDACTAQRCLVREVLALQSKPDEDLLLELVRRRNVSLSKQVEAALKSADFARVAAASSRCVDLMDVEDVLRNLSQHPSAVFRNLCAEVQTLFDKQRDEEAVHHLLKSLPLLSANWYWDFMNALKSSENVTVRRLIEPREQYQKRYEEHSKQAKAVPKVPSASTRVAVDADQMSARKKKVDALANEQSLTTSRNDYMLKLNNYKSTARVKPLRLRGYQVELAAAALAGKNCIVCAPTGSGKTVVAVHIAERHLVARRAANVPARVVFFVPTVPLVSQQEKVFKTYLADRFAVRGMAGGETATVKTGEVLKHSVVVLTPQILVNMLGKSSGRDDIRLDDFTLFMFDECHHCESNHAYNVLMQQYNDARLDESGVALPQVVGLTASLGVGSGKHEQAAVDHIFKMAANLAADHLSVVRDEANIAELEREVYVPHDELQQVPSTFKQNPFAIHIEGIMEWIERVLRPTLEYLVDNNSECVPREVLDIPVERYSPAYVSWFSKLQRLFLPLVNESAVKCEALSFLNHLRIYCNALELNAHLPTRQALNYLKEQMDVLDAHKTIDADSRLLKRFTDRLQFLEDALANEPRKAIVERLREILVAQYAKEPDSRTLVFARTRELTRALAAHLNEQRVADDIRASHLTGVTASSERGGQGTGEQAIQLEYFRTGAVKILVATSVAEEGLDIATCNLVIKYNHVSNEVAAVQRRGRGRAIGSRSVLLAQEGWIADKELANLVRERLMKRCIERILSMGSDYFSGRVKEKARTLKEERQVDETCRDQKRRMLTSKFDLLCKKCDEFVCASSAVRRVQSSHYVIVDASIWQRSFVEPHAHPRVLYLMAVAGKIVCRQCRDDWGIVVKYQGVFMPALKADSVVLRDADHAGPKLLAKQWKKIEENHFVVDPLTRADQYTMYAALRNVSADAADQLEQCIEDAEQLNRQAAERKANEDRAKQRDEQHMYEYLDRVEHER